MKERIWESALTENDKAVIKKGGYGKRRGFGKKPLIVVIDIQYNYVGDDKPIAEQLGDWPSGGGEVAWRAIENTQKLLDAARKNDIPIMYTRNVQKEIKFDSFSAKTDRDQTKYIDGHRGTMIVDEIAPHDNDLVLNKAYASAFYGTPLLSWLVKLGVDTLIVVGGSTGGCVRATSVDAVSRNFKVAVVEDCVYDRIEMSHKASLLDMWMKYTDVTDSNDIISYLNGLGETNV